MKPEQALNKMIDRVLKYKPKSKKSAKGLRKGRKAKRVIREIGTP